MNSTQFRDNVDNLAPLASMAFTASLILYLKSRQILYLFLQIPAVYFVIKWQLLQPIVAFIPSIILIALKERYLKLRFLSLTPLLIVVGYISAIKLLPLTPLVMVHAQYVQYKYRVQKGVVKFRKYLKEHTLNLKKKDTTNGLPALISWPPVVYKSKGNAFNVTRYEVEIIKRKFKFILQYELWWVNGRAYWNNDFRYYEND